MLGCLQKTDLWKQVCFWIMIKIKYKKSSFFYCIFYRLYEKLAKKWIETFEISASKKSLPVANHIFNMIINVICSISPGKCNTFPETKPEKYQSSSWVVVPQMEHVKSTLSKKRSHDTLRSIDTCKKLVGASVKIKIGPEIH